MEPQEQFHIHGGQATQEITIIHKKGLNEEAPYQVTINGNIDAVKNWIQKKEVNPATSHVMINRENKWIRLVINEKSQQRDAITGFLAPDPDFTKWMINTTQRWDHKELSNFVKMNRASFPLRAEATKLANELANIKIKLDKEMETASDNRGNARAMVAQKVIESNIPEKFRLEVPIFKGFSKTLIEVECWVDAGTFEVTLMSPQAKEIEDGTKNKLIDDEKAAIGEMAPTLVVIEI